MRAIFDGIIQSDGIVPARKKEEGEAVMKIYFSCSLTGGRADEHIYAHIVDHLLERGFDVPTAHLARPEVMDLERIVDPEDVFRRDIDWIDGCDVVIAEVSTPSHGVGYEIAYALGIGKRVLCAYREGAAVSKMITGNRTPGLMVKSYRSEDEVIELIDSFLDG